MKDKPGVNYCPKCGRQRIGDQEYDKEIRAMVFACDMDDIFIPRRVAGQGSGEVPYIMKGTVDK